LVFLLKKEGWIEPEKAGAKVPFARPDLKKRILGQTAFTTDSLD